MIGNVWLLVAPAEQAQRVGVVVSRGQPVEIVAVNGEWYLVRWTLQDQTYVTGWALRRFVVPMAAIPPIIVTPVAGRA
jgi:hypothetical protein